MAQQTETPGRSNTRKTNKRHIRCEGEELENVWHFKYLGSRFRADGDYYADVKARIAAATTTAGKMRNIWASRHIPLRLKLRIYRSGVCVRLTYDCEAWKLDSRSCKILNGVNSRMLSHITNKTIKEEVRKETRTFDVVINIRSRAESYGRRQTSFKGPQTHLRKQVRRRPAHGHPRQFIMARPLTTGQKT